jgi:hypothetical protein
MAELEQPHYHCQCDCQEKPKDFFPGYIVVKNKVTGWYQLKSATREEVLYQLKRKKRAGAY